MASIRYDESRDGWVVDFRRGKLRNRLYFPSRREAQDFRTTLLLHKFGAPEGENEQQKTPVREVIDRYKQTITSTKAPHTQYFEGLVFDDFSKAFGNMLLQEIKLADLQAYQARLRIKTLGQTVNRRFNTLCHFCM